jgi:hypothetical protein
MAIEEGLAGVDCDTDYQPVGQNPRASGDRAEVPACLPDHGGRFTRDGRLVDGGHAFDHVAVAGDDLAGSDQHQIALAQIFRVDRVGGGVMARLSEPLGQDRPAHALERRRLGLAPTFRQAFGEVGKQHREPEPEGDGQDEACRLHGSGLALAHLGLDE